MKLNIDADLKKLIPPLAPDERALLEASIIAEGCRDAIITWNDTIVDGHNRYEICTKHGIPFRTEDRDFESMDEVKVWMIDNQKGRRNLTDGWKFELAQERKRILAEKGKKNMSLGGGDQKTGMSIIDKPDIEPINTRNEIAADLGWSTGKVAMADVVWKQAPVEVKEKVKSGEVTINEAYKEVRQEQKKKKHQQRRSTFNDSVEPSSVVSVCYHGNCLDYLKTDMPKIDLLLSDPPYAMDYKSGWNDWDKVNNDKRHDTIDIIDKAFALCKDKMAEDAHVYIFGNPFEIENIKPIFTKYFTLKNILVWDRGVIGMGDLKTYGRSYDIIYFGYNKVWKELNGTRERDVLQFNRVSPNNLVHPTEKPVDLLEYIIKKSTSEGGNVLDPFAGSCTTHKAANDLGRNSYGSELELKYIPSWILNKA
jgi:hypothetical protein